MHSCPIKTSKEWQTLSAALGEDRAMLAFIRNEGVTPDVARGRELITNKGLLESLHMLPKLTKESIMQTLMTNNLIVGEPIIKEGREFFQLNPEAENIGENLGQYTTMYGTVLEYDGDFVTVDETSLDSWNRIADVQRMQGQSLNDLCKNFLTRIGVGLSEQDDVIAKYGSNGVAEFADRMVRIQSGMMNQALPEEALHFFIEMMPSDHPALMEALDKIRSTQTYKDTLEQYRNNPNYRTKEGQIRFDKIKKEALAKELAAQMKAKEKKGWVVALIEAIMNWIKNVKVQKDPMEILQEMFFSGDTALLNTNLSSNEVYNQLTDKEKTFYEAQVSTPEQAEALKKILAYAMHTSFDEETHTYTSSKNILGTPIISTTTAIGSDFYSEMENPDVVAEIVDLFGSTLSTEAGIELGDTKEQQSKKLLDVITDKIISGQIDPETLLTGVKDSERLKELLFKAAESKTKTIFGTAIHAIAEAVILGKKLDLEPKSAEHPNGVDPIIYKLMDKATLSELVYGTARKPGLMDTIKKMVDRGSVIMTEVAMSNGVLAGVLDVIEIKKDGTAEIHDFKTKYLKNYGDKPYVKKELNKEFTSATNTKSSVGVKDEPATIKELKNIERTALEKWSQQLSIYKKFLMEAGVRVGGLHIVGIPYRLDAITKKVNDVGIEEVNNIPFDEDLADYMFDDIDPAMDASIKEKAPLKEDDRLETVKQINENNLKDSFAKSLAKLMQLLNKFNKGDKTDAIFQLLNDANTKTNRLRDQITNIRQTLENFDIVKEKNLLGIQKNFLEMIDSSGPIIETALRRFDELKKLTPTDKQGESQKLNELMKLNDFLKGYQDMFEELLGYLKEAPSDNRVKEKLTQIVGLTAAVHNEYIDIITPSIIKLLGESFNEDLLNNMKREYNELISAAKLRGDTKRADSLRTERDNLPSYAVIKDLLKGNKGDVGPIFSKLIATISNPDVIIAGAAKRLKATLDRVRLENKVLRDSLGKELQKRFDVYGRGPNVKENNESLTYIVEEINPFTGESMEVIHFLSEFDEKLYSERNKLEFATIEAAKTNDPNIIKAAKKELRDFEKKYLQTGYTAEYYRLTKALDITVQYQGRDMNLREIESNINDQIKRIELEYSDDDLATGKYNDAHFKELQNLNEQKAELREKLDNKGNPKTGDALKIAEALEEYDKNKKLLYEYTEDTAKYNKAREKAKLEYGESSEQFEKWMSENTRLTISDEYYTDLADLNAERLEIAGDVTGSEEIKKLYEELRKIIAPYKDKDGNIKGFMISEETSKKIKDVQTRIDDLQRDSTFNPFNMYTKEESEKMRALRYLKDNKLPGYSQVEYDTIVIKARQRQMAMLAKNPSLQTDFDAKEKRYKELNSILFSMTKKENTKYYYAEREKQERIFAESKNVSYKEFKKSEELYNEFKQSDWFLQNHIIKTKVLYEDSTTGDTREARTETPSYQWRRNMPIEKYITQSPGRQFTKTILKDSYIDDNGKEVKLRDTDNLDIKERLKPKSNEDYRKEFGVDHPYLNKAFIELRDKYKKGMVTAKERVDYENLLYIHDKMLKAQEGIEVSQRLGLAVPFEEKRIFERTVESGGQNLVETGKSFIQEVKRNLGRTDQDIDQNGVSTKEDDDRGDNSKLATVDNGQVKFVPVRYSRKGDAKNASYNVWGGVLNYLGSITRKKELETELAFINGLEQILGEKANQPKSEDNNKILNNIYKRFIPDLQAKINLGSNTRLEILKSFVNSVMYNEEYFAGYDILGVNTQKAISTVMALSSYTILGVAPINWTVNWLSGNIQNMVEAAGGRNYNFADYAAAHTDLYGGGKYGSAVNDMKSDFLKAKVGNLSFWGQIMEIFDPIQGEIENEYGHKTNFNHFKNIFHGGVFAGKIWGEWEIQMKSFVAFMKNHKLYDGHVIDKETFITKKIGVDVDTLSLKEIEKLRLDALKEWDKLDVNVLDMLEMQKDGIVRVKDQYKDDFQLGSSEFSDIVAKLHSMQKKLNGSYAKFDKAYFEKTSMGRMAYFFRKYFVPLGVARWGTRRPEFEGMVVEQGFYLTFIQTMGTDLAKFRFNVVKNWDTYSPTEKRAIKKTLADVAIVLALIAAYSLLFGYDPNDKDRMKKLREKGWAAQASVFVLLKLKSETEQFLPPLPFIGAGGLDEVKRAYSNPSLIFNQTTQYINIVKGLGGHAMSLTGLVDSSNLYYKKDTDESGLKDKGDAKIISAMMKTFVGYSGRTFHPVDAIKSYEYMSRQ